MIRRRLRKLYLFLRNVVYSFILTSILLFYLPRWMNRYGILNDLSLNALEFIRYKEIHSKRFNSTEARYLINKYNQEETIMNLEKFGPITNDTPIVVVQVGKYRASFKYLIASLCGVVGIQNALVIFSMSHLDDNVNQLIKSIEFCRVLQIFYPYSLQAYVNEFPGYSVNDCPHNMGIENAKVLNCTGAYTPDVHGQYRHPQKVTNKHFWWWTANKVFEDLSCTEGYTGTVIFLEEDVYVMEDFLYMIIYMTKLAKTLPQCEFVSIGTDQSVLYDNAYRVEFSTWDPKYHSDVLAMEASTWNIIVAHYDLFCLIDDSSWSRSLLYLSLNRRENKKFKVVYSTIPRVIKTYTSSDGVLGSFDALNSVVKALTIQKKIKNNSFLPYLEVYTHIDLDDDEYAFFDITEGEGGWSDPRDLALCNNITLNKVNKILLEMKTQFRDY